MKTLKPHSRFKSHGSRLALTTALTAFFTTTALSQNGLQDQDGVVGDYFLSKVDFVQAQSRASFTEAIFVPFLNENRKDYSIYDTFHFDQSLPLKVARSNTDNSSYYAPLRNFIVEGQGPRQLTAGLENNTSTNCDSPVDYLSVFSTENLVINNSTLELIEIRERCVNPALDQFRNSRLSELVIRGGMTLDNSKIIDLVDTRLAFGSHPSFKLTVENASQYVMKTASGLQKDIDVLIKAGASLKMGEYPKAASLTANPLRATGSSLTMESGSQLLLEGAQLHLVGDPTAAVPTAQQSFVEDAIITLKGTALKTTELDLSVLNSANSQFLFQHPRSELRAGVYRLTGNNKIAGYPGASMAWRTSQENYEPSELLSVAGGTTVISNCLTCGSDFFTLYLRELDVAQGATFELQRGVNIDSAGLRLVKVAGVLSTNIPELLPDSGSQQILNLRQVEVAPSGTLALQSGLTLRFDDRIGVASSYFLNGTLDFRDTGAITSEPKIHQIEANRGVLLKMNGSSTVARLNPDGWSQDLGGGVTLDNFSDQVFVVGNFNKIDGLGQASLVLEAVAPGKSAADYATGGFNDPDFGPGTYNVINVGKDVSNDYPTISQGDQFGSVVLGTSMPKGLVATITRGLDDPEILVQPGLGAKARVVQVKLSLAADQFSLAYADTATNDNQSVQVDPVLSNASGSLQYFGPNVRPTDGGAAYQGTVSLDANTGRVTLTPTAGDGAVCGNSNTGGRTFEVLVVATQDLQFQAQQTASTTFIVQVCAGGSVSPYIDYPNILAADNVAVGTTVTKAPKVVGFTPNNFAVSPGEMLPAGLSLDPSTGVISGTPTEAANGADASFTITATDGVVTANDPVTFVIDPDVTYPAEQAEIGVPFQSAAPVTSPYAGGSTVGTYNLSNTPAGSWSINGQGEISGTPETFGDNVFTVSYKVGPDGDNNVVSTTFHLQVTGDPINISYTPSTAMPGSPVTLTPTVTNDRDVVTFAAVLPAGWAIDVSTGVITGTMPVNSEPSIEVTASDKYTSGSTRFVVPAMPPVVQQVTGGPAGLSATLSVTGCTAIVSAAFTSAPDTPSKPFNTDFPFGLLDFELSGCNSVQNGVGISIQYSEVIPSNAVLYKEESGNYALYPDTIQGDTLYYSLTDNGEGDDDPAATVIRDPAGLGVARPIAAPTPVPLAPLALYGLLGLLMLALALRAQRHRQLRL